jgi:acyl-CoA thioesterase-1
MQALRWAVVLLLICGLIAACTERPKLERLPSDAVVLAFGDSLTFGSGASEPESYPAQLEALIGRRVVRAGVPGEVTARGLERLPEVIEEHRPKLVIVCLGGNDMLRKVSEAEIRANLKAIIKAIKDEGIAVVLVGVPKPALITGPAEFYAEIAKEFGIPYEDRVVTSVLYTPDMKADPIHPNAKGYRRMAEALAELLKKAGAI